MMTPKKKSPKLPYSLIPLQMTSPLPINIRNFSN